MEENKPENPPAFPTTKDNFDEQSHLIKLSSGMTLRDYFAAKAMQAFLFNKENYESTHMLNASKLATASYDMADEMLKERMNHVR